MTKYIFVTGGVVSGLGKGIAAASIGKLLSGQFRVVPVKCDGYLNVDPGTMNPFEHGEVFVLDDGGEVDMDFGHYERFLDINCKFSWNLTTGKIFGKLIADERKGLYLGKTVQIIPHVVNEVKNTFKRIAQEEKADIVIVEIGGTVGDIENQWFLEAARQMKKDVGSENVLYVHLTYVPYLKNVGQQKSKPAQHDVERLRQRGIFPDIILGRCEQPLDEDVRKKIAMYCDVDYDAVISAPDTKNIYDVPLDYERQKLHLTLGRLMNFKPKADLKNYRRIVDSMNNPKHHIRIALCGKYTALADAYASVIEAVHHAAAHLSARADVILIEATDIETGKVKAETLLKGFDGLIVPIGWGSRGAEGKIECIKYAREHNMPFLGLCYGLQMAVVEFARNVCKLKGANSTEVDAATKYPVVDILPEQKSADGLGGTARLGLYEAKLKSGSIVSKLYNSTKASERHRHRYEVNPQFHQVLEKNGLVLSGTSCEGRLAEFIELPNHRYFVATQAHPEYRSRLEKPSPLFLGLVKACLSNKNI